MEGFQIEIEVSLRDCRRFSDFIKDREIAKGFNLEMIQTSSNVWLLSSDEYVPDYEVQEIINELEEICEGFEVEFIPEY
ncbi:hypothetical protein UFOVP597_30 [uncultured Caudovirales phage]|uniref:Uncharacterized protein n=1 Tax=uncultured Caudovirales phage TaxID=2100421 RepID=A0A6J5N303_9CAUD|nr:hypothetical protein UFOVP597_30 [uncultured Caudovirales phage]